MRGAQANGEAIQAARLGRGLTQEQLASLAGVDVKTVRKAERGQRVDLGTFTRISFSLDVDVSSIIVTTRSPSELELRRRDAVRRWHHGWETHDMVTLLSIYHEDAVLHLPGAPDIPFAGEHRGKEAIRHANDLEWSMCETEPSSKAEFSLLVSENTVVLSDKKGTRLPNGRTARLSCVQIFTFLHNSELVVDHRVEYDTLTFTRLLQLPRLEGADRTQPPPGCQNSETSR